MDNLGYSSRPATFLEDFSVTSIGFVCIAFLVPLILLPGVSIGQILNIESFLDKCPLNDPAYATIRADFEIRRNGDIVGEIDCSEPVSNLPVSEYTNELIVLQGLRTIYYMDKGKTEYLPWTDSTLYNWMKTKIDGINIDDNIAGGRCCSTFDGKKFIDVAAQNESNREFDRSWRGLSGNIGLYVHEARHVDGFGHTSCCGITNGCDQTYDEANLSTYGTQWWLNMAWLTGEINVGVGCQSPSAIQQIANWHLSSTNNTFRRRFCETKPPELALPDSPGGSCGSAPAVVALASPSDSARGISVEPELTWQMAEGATSYSIQLASDSSFIAILIEQTSILSLFIGISGLDYGTTYYWRVKSINEWGESDWSATGIFTTNYLPVVINSIEDIELIVGGDPFTFALDPFFSDEDGDTLSYSANSSDPSVAIVEVSGDTVVVSAVDLGTALIHLDADDGREGIASTYFTVEVPSGVAVERLDSGLPEQFVLEQNFPNPFNSHTSIHFALPEASNVKLLVYNITGREIAVLVSGDYPAGYYSIHWDASGLPSGNYLYRLEAGTYSNARALMVLK